MQIGNIYQNQLLIIKVVKNRGALSRNIAEWTINSINVVTSRGAYLNKLY